jgi:Ta0938
LKVRETGCALCGATWGDYWADVEEQRMFFCCEVCASEFSNMILRVKRETGWDSIDQIRIQGNFRGRDCEAASGPKLFRFIISFNDDGTVRNFIPRPEEGTPPV